MTPPTWLDRIGRKRPRPACWTCGREATSMRFRAEDLRPHGWRPPQTLQIPGLVRLFDGVLADADRRRLAADGADLES